MRIDHLRDLRYLQIQCGAVATRDNLRFNLRKPTGQLGSDANTIKFASEPCHGLFASVLSVYIALPQKSEIDIGHSQYHLR
jgi:hypothetical protein